MDDDGRTSYTRWRRTEYLKDDPPSYSASGHRAVYHGETNVEIRTPAFELKES
jgi:hypothetical protein